MRATTRTPKRRCRRRRCSEPAPATRVRAPSHRTQEAGRLHRERRASSSDPQAGCAATAAVVASRGRQRRRSVVLAQVGDVGQRRGYEREHERDGGADAHQARDSRLAAFRALVSARASVERADRPRSSIAVLVVTLTRKSALGTGWSPWATLPPRVSRRRQAVAVASHERPGEVRVERGRRLGDAVSDRPA